MHYKYRFSIFTPTYNRGHLLESVYTDLCNQTFKDFEWIVIGDESCLDDTDIIMDNLSKSQRFPIKYLKRSKSGLHNAWRTLYTNIEGRYVIRADDDDTIPCNAFEVFNKYWSELETTSYYNVIWEIRARCGKPDGSLHGPVINDNPYISDFNEINFVKNQKYLEMQSCWKSEILINEAAIPSYFHYEDKAINYPEHLLWSKVSRKYKTYFVNDIVRIYNDTPNSLSKDVKNNFHKLYTSLVHHFYTLVLMRDLLIKYRPTEYIRSIAMVCYYDIIVSENTGKFIDNRFDKLLYYLFKPLIYLLYFYRMIFARIK